VQLEKPSKEEKHMREVSVQDISEKIAEMCIDSNYLLGDDVIKAIDDALAKEESPVGKEVIKQIQENIDIAKKGEVPMCQDTGLAVLFLEIGQDVKLTGGNLHDSIEAGIRKGYQEGYLRKSAVKDPVWDRSNTGDNTPGIVHIDIVPGDKVKIMMAPKGGGAENMSALKMLKPSDGAKGVVDFVVNHVKASGPNPCPPIVVGVGVGGTFEKVAYLAKKSLLRPLGQPNPNPNYAKMEQEILTKINNLGIGPQGFGGTVTALAVHIDYFPTHIASLPVAVNLNCHASRHMETVL
jgi:fumarate hydratase subunit alpha